MMKEEPPRNAMRIWLPEAVIVVLAIVALRKDNPYGYYIFLRWVACPVFAWIAWKAYSRGSGIMMVIAAGVLAVLFNPIIRVMLDREKWEILNIAMVAVAIWSAVVSIRQENAAGRAEGQDLWNVRDVGQSQLKTLRLCSVIEQKI